MMILWGKKYGSSLGKKILATPTYFRVYKNTVFLSLNILRTKSMQEKESIMVVCGSGTDKKGIW